MFTHQFRKKHLWHLQLHSESALVLWLIILLENDPLRSENTPVPALFLQPSKTWSHYFLQPNNMSQKMKFTKWEKK